MTLISAFDHEKIELPSGLVLEGSLSVPPVGVSQTGSKLAVCLHPWSWFGGRMDDSVIHAVKRIMLAKGYCVLRYNSRGAGSSSGWPSFTGLQEVEDLKELVQWALERMPAVDSLIIAGYSHGSLIASLYPLFPEERKIKVSHILISYPLSPRALLTAFRGGYYASTLEALLRDSRSNVLVVYGDCDEFTGVRNYDTWADVLRAVTEGENKGHLQIVKVEGGNHFWTDSEPRNVMLEGIQNFMQ